MSYMTCELRACINKNLQRAAVRVNENIGDLSYTTWICQQCANALGIKKDDDLPEPVTIEKRLRHTTPQRSRKP